MKNQNGFLSENWTFKRALRVSIKFALIYAILNLIWVWIFGSKPEIVLNIELTEEITKTIVLPWNSWFNVIPDSLGLILLGITLFWILKYFNLRAEKDNVKKNDLVVGLVGGLCGGMVVGLVYGLVVGLVSGLVYGLVSGLVWLFKLIFSEKFWNSIWKGILWFWNILIK